MKPKLSWKWNRILFVLALVSLNACTFRQLKGNAGNSSTKATENPSKVATSFSPSGDARKDVRDALLRLKTAYPYRLTEVSSMSGGGQTVPETTRVVEFAASNRSHMKWTGGPGGDIEAISIGEKHYWFSDGRWTEGTIPSRLGYRGEDFAQKLSEMVKEVKYVGQETINGLPCHAYTGTFETTLGGQQWTGTAKVWIGGADGLVHQSDSEFHVATFSGKSHTVYDYNINVKVEPPQM